MTDVPERRDPYSLPGFWIWVTGTQPSSASVSANITWTPSSSTWTPTVHDQLRRKIWTNAEAYTTPLSPEWRQKVTLALESGDHRAAYDVLAGVADALHISYTLPPEED